MKQTEATSTDIGTTADDSPETGAAPHDAELTALRVHQYGQGAGMHTRIELFMTMTAPRLVESGEVDRTILQAARADLEEMTEFADFDRLRDRVAETQRLRFTHATQQAKCEADLPQIVRRGDDPSDCEKVLATSRAEVATLTERLKILREAMAEAHRKCSNRALQILRSVSLRFRNDSDQAKAAAFHGFAASEQLHNLIRAQRKPHSEKPAWRNFAGAR